MSSHIHIGLGTVQFGLPYGINQNGPLMPESTVMEILQLASTRGIQFFDTAINYGVAEERIGKFLKQSHVTADISTKIPIVEKALYLNAKEYKNYVFQSVKESLKRLGLKKLNLLQFHQSALDFLSQPHLADLFHACIKEGVANEIGISVYSPEEAKFALTNLPITTLQAPVNLLERRFLSTDLKLLYQKHHTRLIARSIFLQGVLVSSAPLPPVHKHKELALIKDECKSIALTLNEKLETLAIQFIFNEVPEIETVLIGVDSKNALLENLATIESAKSLSSRAIGNAFKTIAERFSASPLVNPSFWNTK